ncbi:MAG: glycosyltransferase family 39 protein [Micromonosporaceae bacterium]|nr:glycosyltransferase family 39 protein [Micromonosporaceae bacterium]
MTITDEPTRHRLTRHRLTRSALRPAPIPRLRPPAGGARPYRWLTARGAAVAALLAGTALLYLWGLDRSGWANAYYSAAAQAGSRDWTAYLFGSLDAGNAITVDKTPAALWVMSLSVRLFGLNPWAILAPQALAGLACVGVLYATVRRWYGHAAGVLAGGVLAVTPVAVLMFRYNNPDALLTLLLVLAAWACVRAVETGATRWMVLVGALVGMGFLTKMLQAFLVVPALAATYLVAGPGSLRRRTGQLVAGGLALVVTAGWWVALVELVPTAHRPYIGGSQTNSALELTFGYNGLGRLTGEEAGAIGTWWGPTGLDRLFRFDFAPGVSWLLPAALGLLVVGLSYTRRAPRTDRTRAGFLLWGGWLLVTWLTFSFMSGIYHAYYNVALAPAIGAVVGMGGRLLWRRVDRVARLLLLLVVLATVGWSAVLSGQWLFLPWLGPAVLVVGGGATLVLLALTVRSRPAPRAAAAVLATCVVTGLAAPVAWSVATAATPHEGAIPTVGPSEPEPVHRRPFNGVGGGLVNATRPTEPIVAALLADADRYTWVAATIGANNAAGYQLATGRPVLALGGFNGSDPFPTLAQFQQLVAEGRIHWFLDSIWFPNAGGSTAAAEIAAWVHLNYRAETIGGVRFYDLTQPPRRPLGRDA